MDEPRTSGLFCDVDHAENHGQRRTRGDTGNADEAAKGDEMTKEEAMDFFKHEGHSYHEKIMFPTSKKDREYAEKLRTAISILRQEGKEVTNVG